jgi:hypothetical protein
MESMDPFLYESMSTTSRWGLKDLYKRSWKSYAASASLPPIITANLLLKHNNWMRDLLALAPLVSTSVCSPASFNNSLSPSFLLQQLHSDLVFETKSLNPQFQRLPTILYCRPRFSLGAGLSWLLKLQT